MNAPLPNLPAWLAPYAGRLTPYATREAWLTDTQRGDPGFCLGATDAVGLLDLYPHTGIWPRPWSVRAAHLFGDPATEGEEGEGSEDTRRGSFWEEPAAAWWAAELRPGTEVYTGLCRIECGWLRPSPDMLGLAPTGELCGAEIKMPRPGPKTGEWAGQDLDLFAWEAFRQDPPAPVEYIAQTYLQLYALNRAGIPVAWIDLVAGFSFSSWRVIRVHHDPRQEQVLVREVARRRLSWLVRGEQPPADDSREAIDAFMALKMQERKPIQRDATDEEAAIAREVHRLRGVEKQANERRRTLHAQLAERTGDVRKLRGQNPDGSRWTYTFGANGSPTITHMQENA